MSTAPTITLTSTSYLVLGLLSLRGPMTPYEMKQMVAVSIGCFWSFPHSQLYAEPDRLADAGLVEVDQEDGGRRRKRYSITDEGRDALRAWVAEPVVDTYEVRDPGLLRLFFGAVVEPAEVQSMARGVVEAYVASLAQLDAIEALIGDEPSLAYPAATLRLGKRVTRAYIEFWEEIAAQPPSA